MHTLKVLDSCYVQTPGLYPLIGNFVIIIYLLTLQKKSWVKSLKLNHKTKWFYFKLLIYKWY